MKSVVITGASSGIGAAAARRFARSGYRVFLVARSEEKLTSVAAEIGEAAVVLPCDASDPLAVEEMAKAVLSISTPDIVINSAGAGVWKTIEDTLPGDAQSMMDAPYFAAFHTTRAFLPAMKSAGRGVIIHVNSPACFVNWRSSIGYAAARHALRGFHEALAQDLHGSGIHSCHAVLGEVSSEYWDNNPGSADLIPRLSRLVPRQSPEQAAEHLFALARAPRNTMIRPLLLDAMITLGRPFPPVLRWMARL